jgi:hypothetical protein
MFFIPGTPISDGLHTVYLEVRDTIGNLANTTWNFTAEVLPIITNLGPGDGTTINDATPTISADYSDNTAINISSVRLRVDTDFVTPSTLTVDGVSYQQLTTLSDGSHNIYLEVKDTYGNLASTSWSFTIHTSPPTISNLVPPLGSETNTSTPTISAGYDDPAGIDIASVLLQIDGFDVTALATITQSSISYTPSTAIADGTHQVYLEVRDAVGNLATTSWNFTVNASGLPDGDIDNDYLPDDWEIEHFGNLNESAMNDTDNDGLTNLEEYQEGTDPNLADTDGDGISDGDEVEAGTNPLVAETGSDFLSQYGLVLAVIIGLIIPLKNLARNCRYRRRRRPS